MATLSYAKLTQHAEQEIRDHLAKAAEHRAAGNTVNEFYSRGAAVGAFAMWEGLALQHLDVYERKSFPADVARLYALMRAYDAAPAA